MAASALPEEGCTAEALRNAYGAGPGSVYGSHDCLGADF